MNKAELIKQQLSKTVGHSNYNGWNNRTTYGYHSYNIGDVSIIGQRDPTKRIKIFKQHVSFENKTVVDFGCNVGAMLHHLPEIYSGVGYDYDVKCILAGNNISKLLELDDKINLYQHDFDQDSYQHLQENIIHFDICFLLSLGSWVKSWKTLYDLACKVSSTIILETNNSTEGVPQLQFFRDKNKQITRISEHSFDDSTGNHDRETFLIK